VNRIVQPELLDSLQPTDPRARRSRRDLQRVNFLMRNHQLLAKAWPQEQNDRAPQKITELGAGDGTFLLRLAQTLSPKRPPMTATLIDQQNNVSTETLERFSALGWRAAAIVADIFDWLPAAEAGDVAIANLFLHHFDDTHLAKLLHLVSQHAPLFIAIEPRRAAWPLFCSGWLGAIGCNAVTRHDAKVSVRAGFAGRELSALWPDKPNWQLTEHRTGAFSHLFVARKIP
jgi:hypothetical protein